MKNIIRVISVMLCIVMTFSMTVFSKVVISEKPDISEAHVEEMLKNMDYGDLYSFGTREADTLELVEYYGEIGGYHIGVFFPTDGFVMPAIGEVIVGNYVFYFSNSNYGKNLFAYKDGEFILHSETDLSGLLSEDELKQLADIAGASFIADKLVDVDYDAWYGDAVRFCIENGYMYGIANDRFAPSMTLTRAQMVQILFNISGEDKADYTGDTGFADVPEDVWCAPAVNWARKQGITAGVTETAFAPNRDISRQEMVRMFYVYAEHLEYDMRDLDDLEKYEDRSDIAMWAYTETQWAVAQGLISGMTETAICPRGTATRAQAARILMQFIKFMETAEPMDRSGAFAVIKDAIIANGEEHRYFDEYYWDFEDVYGDLSYSAVYNAEEQSIRFTYWKSHAVGIPTNHEYASITVYCLDDTYTYYYVYDNDCITADGVVGNGTYTETSFDFIEDSDYRVSDEESARTMEANTRQGLIDFVNSFLEQIDLTAEDLFVEK